jgi:hypothetical protein
MEQERERLSLVIVLILIYLLGVGIVTATNAVKNGQLSHGLGDLPCDKWVLARSQADQATTGIMVAWAQGYLSGVLNGEPLSFNASDNKGIQEIYDSECTAHRTLTLFQALSKFVQEQRKAFDMSR